MKCWRFLMSVVVISVVMVGFFPINSQAVAAAPADCSKTETVAGSQAAASDSPVKIGLELKKASLEGGIELRVLFENSGADGFSLDVCPAMLLCCVKGLHPLVSCDDTGVGLLDVCTVSKPTSHEVFLPANSAFSFDLNIPSERLPPTCLATDKRLSVYVCYEADNQHTLRSNVLQFTMK